MFFTTLQIITIAVKSLIGGIVGYFTNDLAIKMLFKKKFGLGGIVIKTRLEFIENATDLVEDDILTTETLKKEIGKENFKEVLAQVIHDFLQVHLPNSIPDELSIGHLANFSESFDRLLEILFENLDAPLADLIELASNEIKVDDLLTESQAATLARNGVSVLTRVLQENELIQPFLHQLYHEYGERELTELIPARVFDQVGMTIGELVSNTGEVLKQHFDGDIDDVIHVLSEAFELKQLCHHLVQSLAEKKWSDWIGENRVEQLLAALIKRLIQLARSDSGNRLLISLSQTLLKILKDTDQSLFDLVPNQISVKFEGFVYLRMVDLIKEVTHWVEERRDDIEVMINLSFADRNFLARLIHSLGFSLAEIFNVVDLIKEYLNGKIDLDQLADLQSREFVKLLKKNTLTEILSKLEENGVLTESSLTAALQSSMISLLELIQPSALYPFLTRAIDELATPNRIKAVIDGAIFKTCPKLLKDHVLYHDRFSQWIRNTIFEKISYLSSKKLNEIVTEAQVKASLLTPQSFLVSKLMENQTKFTSYLSAHFTVATKNRKINSVIGSNSQLQSSVLGQLKKQILDSKKWIRPLKIATLYKRIIGKKNDADLISDIHRLLIEHLHVLTQGSVKKISKQNLIRLSADRLCHVVEDFMGKELKPITRFGAGLGLIAGAGLSLLPDVRSLGEWAGIPPAIITLSLSAIMFGLTGWGTNWLALKMIFRPYFAKHLWGRRIPLTPGVVSQNKTTFAAKMGKFVDSHLLQKNSIESMFHDNSERIKSTIKTSVNRENYKIIDHQVGKHKSKLADLVSEFLINRMRSESPEFIELIGLLINHIKETKLDDLPFDRPEQKMKQVLQKVLPKIKEELLQRTYREEVQGRRLSSFLTPKVQNTLETLTTQWITDWIERHGDQLFRSEMVIRAFKGFENKWDQLLDRSIQSVIDTDQFKQFQNHVFSYVMRLFGSKKGNDAVARYLFKIMDREMSPQKQFNELFGGKLMDFMLDNIDRLAHYLLKIALRYLRQNHEKISETVYQNLLKDADFLSAQAIRLAKGELFETIEDLTKIRLPEFFRTHEMSLQEIIRKQMAVIGTTKVGQVGTELDQKKLGKLIDLCLGNQALFRIGKQFTGELLHILAQDKVRNYLDKVGRGNLSSILEVLEHEIQLVSDHLHRQMVLSPSQLINAPIKLIKKVMVQIAANTEVRHLFVDITEDQFREIVDNGMDWLTQSEAGKSFIDETFSQFTDRLYQSKMTELVDMKALKSDILNLTDRLICHDVIRPELKQILSGLMVNVLPQLNHAVDRETKDGVLDLAIGGFEQTLKKHISSVLGVVKFNEIVESQIKKMHPQKIEITFRKFAGRYFPKLINYGFSFGLAFGLLMDLFYYAVITFSQYL